MFQTSSIPFRTNEKEGVILTSQQLSLKNSSLTVKQNESINFELKNNLNIFVKRADHELNGTINFNRMAVYVKKCVKKNNNRKKTNKTHTNICLYHLKYL